MKYPTILLCVFLVCFNFTNLFSESIYKFSKINRKNSQTINGKNGKIGQFGENGENGKEGENGGNGGNGGSGWLRGGNGGNGGNAVDSTDQTNQNIDEIEYSVLKERCRQVVFKTISKFDNPLDADCLAVYKKLISSYLIETGTPEARKIWEEYESIKWAYPEILNI